MTMTVSAPRARRYELIVLLVAAAIFLGCIVSPPALMDDVDSVQASIAHNMLKSGDWVTPRLDGVKYFEKPPLKYWLIAISFEIFGVHDWAARLPLALLDVALCWLVFRIGLWGFGPKAGYYAGLIVASCIGLFLFTRILIADSQLTLAIIFSAWCFLRSLDPGEAKPRLWAVGFWAAIGVAILLKGFIGVVFPIGAGFLYLFFTHQLRARETYRRLAPFWGILALLAIAAPWHILAILRNPPYFRFDLTSGPGHYRGFFWAWFFNEHILRFLSRRYPHDYNTVPRLWFWLFNLLWLFPGSVYLPALFQLRYRGEDRASRLRLISLCLIGFVMVFFTLSSTQEYYSMPIYPAFALLLGCGIAADQQRSQKWLRTGDILLASLWTLALAAMIALLVHVWNLPTPGDISDALRIKNQASYTLSLGHMGDLTLESFAYLRTPLIVAAIAALIGAAGLLLVRRRRILVSAIAMVIFFHAARLALVIFDPYLSSKPLADALLRLPKGQLIVSDQYYAFSSVFFYANTDAYLLNGRINNLEYGSNAPDAPHVFIGDSDLKRMWSEQRRYYLLVEHEFMPDIERVIARNYVVVAESGGKYLLTNKPLSEPLNSARYLPAG
jgi:4-amino-4-deoxy-L-arabinose transferase-like glycosyltransferase